MQGVKLAVIACFGIASIGHAAAAEIRIDVSLPQQIMVVSVDGIEKYIWPVSTGHRTYRGAPTPAGTYQPIALYEKHHSRHFHHASMPYSIFFHEGYAIHAALGDEELENLGKTASHGCVRISLENAQILFQLVQQEGKEHTTINVVETALK